MRWWPVLSRWLFRVSRKGIKPACVNAGPPRRSRHLLSRIWFYHASVPRYRTCTPRVYCEYWLNFYVVHEHGAVCVVVSDVLNSRCIRKENYCCWEISRRCWSVAGEHKFQTFYYIYVYIKRNKILMFTKCFKIVYCYLLFFYLINSRYICMRKFLLLPYFVVEYRC